jgi:hypothetical protein
MGGAILEEKENRTFVGETFAASLGIGGEGGLELTLEGVAVNEGFRLMIDVHFFCGQPIVASSSSSNVFLATRTAGLIELSSAAQEAIRGIRLPVRETG